MPRSHRCQRRVRRPRRVRLYLEGLESRCLLSGPGTLAADALFHETLDTALPAGLFRVGVQDRFAGTIGAGPAGAADVNWYEFSLSATAEVRLVAQPGATARPLIATLSLYNDAPPTYDPALFGYIDPYTPDGHRLLAQDDAATHGGPATIDRRLGPGTYWVAVSGSGNDLFYPFLADSGLDGRTGSYRLSIATSDPGNAYDNPAGPVVLASDPAPGATLGQAPFVFRFDLNRALDPDTVAGYNFDPTTLAQLLFNTTNDFSPGGSASDVTGQYLSLGTVAQEPRANELLLAPSAPLTSGYYEVRLPGYGPNGRDYVAQFQVAGLAGNTDPTQQPGTWIGTAYDIPHVTDGRLHQLSGAIGVDPTDPSGFYQAGVEIYHFSIASPGTYTLDAEVFAGRIGSPLDASLTLFKVDDHGNPSFFASNGNTLNNIAGTNGQAPLVTDPALFESLGQGEYYLAVSSGVNFPDPNDPNSTASFDPTIPQSGNYGNSLDTTGPYVLNLLVQPAATAVPHVVSVAPDTGANGNGPLTAIRVRFDQPVNLLALASESYLETVPSGTPNGALSSATLTDAQGNSSELRLGTYDDRTNTATFILLGPVPPGPCTLTLSGAGPEWITSLSGVPLAGNSPDGDFKATIRVVGAASDTSSWASLPGFDSPAHAQPIGVLFPEQLNQGVTITRDASVGIDDTQDDYSIGLLQSPGISIAISGDNLPAGLTINLIDASGTVEASFTYEPGLSPPPFLQEAGTYTLQVIWPVGRASYTLSISYPGTPDNPTPLVIGSGPALRVRLLTNTTAGTAPPAAGGLTGGTAPTVTPAASSSGTLPSSFTLPSSSLLAQGFSPLQGVLAAGGTDSAGTGDRLIARAPASPNGARALAGLLIATQAPLGNLDPETPAALTSVAPGTMAGQAGLRPEMFARFLDVLFEFWGSFAAPAPAGPDVGGQIPAPPAVEGDGGEGGLGAVLPGPAAGTASPDVAGEGSWGWACALAAGALAPSRPPAADEVAARGTLRDGR